MAFAQVESRTSYTFTTGTTHNCASFPALGAGEVYVALVTSDGSATQNAPTDWTTKGTQLRGTFARGSVHVHDVDLGGTTVNFPTGSTEALAVHVLVVSGWSGDLADIEVLFADPGGTTNAPNPPSLNPAGWDVEDTLWIIGAFGSSWSSVTTYPTNYATNGAHNLSGTGTANASISSSWRESAAASEDPGVFAMGSTSSGVIATIAVRPSGAGPATAPELQVSGLVIALTYTETEATPVGKEVGLVWNVDAAIGDQTDLRWNTLDAVGDQLALVWDVFTFIGDEVQSIWDVLGVVGDQVDLRWDVAEAVGDQVSLPWHVLDVIADQLVFVWDVFTPIGDEAEFVWDVMGAVGDQVEFRWDTLAAVGDETELIWLILDVIGDQVGLVWDTLDVVGDQADLQWNTLDAIGDETGLVWGVLVLVGDETEAIWNVVGAVGDEVELRWDTLSLQVSVALINTVGMQIARGRPRSSNPGLMYGRGFQFPGPVATSIPSGAVGKEIALQWNILDAVADEIDFQWHVLVTIGDQVALVWNLTQLAGDQLALVWDLFALAGDEADLRWVIRDALGDQTALVWNVSGSVIDEVSLPWNILDGVGVESDLVWSVFVLAGNQTSLLWDVDAIAGEEVVVLWSVDGPISAPIALIWNVREAVVDESDLLWNVNVATGDETDLQWTTFETIGDEADLRWDVSGAVGDEINVIWDVFALAGDEVDLPWNVLQLAEGQVLYLWGVRETVDDEVQLLWETEALIEVGNEIVLLWKVYSFFKGLATVLSFNPILHRELWFERPFTIQLNTRRLLDVTIQFSLDQRLFKVGETAILTTRVAEYGTKIPINVDDVVFEKLIKQGDPEASTWVPAPFVNFTVGEYRYTLQTATMEPGTYLIEVHYILGSDKAIQNDQFVLQSALP